MNMKDLEEGESKEYLLSVVKSRGYTVSPDQLIRWHRAGLLPRPKQRHLGRHGSKTIYPQGSAEQVIEICRIHEKERRLAYVAWELWWNGFEVNLGIIRDFAQRAVKEWDYSRRKYTWLDSEVISKEIVASSDARIKSKPIRKMRKRIGSQNFPFILQTILAVSTSQYSEDSFQAEADQRDLEKATGMGKVREQLLGALSPWINGEQLNEASRFFGDLNFSADLAVITDEELIHARDEFRACFEPLELAGQIIDKSFGKSAFGFSAIGGLLNGTSPILQPLVLLFWIALRKNKDTKKQVDISIENKHGLAQIILSDRIIESLKIEIPSIATVYIPKKNESRYAQSKGRREASGRITAILHRAPKRAR